MSQEAAVTYRLGTIMLLLCAGAVAALVPGYIREAVALSAPDYGSFGFRIFDLSAENSVLSWYSSAILALAALFMWACGSRDVKLVRRTVLGWRILAVGFLYLSADEMLALHEQYQVVANFLPEEIVGQYRWAWTGLAIVLLGGVAFIPFLRSLTSSARIGLVLAGGIYCFGAVGMEIVEGANVLGAGSGVAGSIAMSIEETMEVVGVLVCIFVVIRYLAPTMIILTAGRHSQKDSPEPARP